MAIPNVDINYLAILIAAIFSMIIGSLWYSPLLFGNAWMKSGRISRKNIERVKQRGMGKYYFAAFIATLVIAFVLEHFVQYTTADNFIEGVITGFWLWLGFIAPVLLGSVLWEGKPIKFYLINISYQFISLAMMGGILAVW